MSVASTHPLALQDRAEAFAARLTGGGKAWILCLTCVMLGVLRLPFGFSYGDEGFYLATSARYLTGDRLFVDEHYTTPMAFDVFTRFLMSISPFDSVLFWRAVGYFAQVGAIAAAVLIISRSLPRAAAVLLFCGLVLYVPFNSSSLYYNNLMQIFLLFAETCWIAALRTPKAKPGRARALGALSAILFCCAGICYLPEIALCVFPGIILLLYWRDRTLRSLTVTWYGTLAAVVTCVLIWLAAAHRLDRAVDNLAEKTRFPQYAMPLARRILFKAFHHPLWPGLGACTLCVGPLAYLSATSRKWSTRAAAAFAALMGLLFVIFIAPPSVSTLSPSLTLFNYCVILTAVCWLAAARMRGVALRPLLPLLAGFLVNLTAAGIVVVSSSTESANITQFNVCLWLVWPALIVLAWKLAEELAKAHPAIATKGMVAVMCVTLGLISLGHLWRYSYYDLPPYQLRSMFEKGKLHGIISTAERVRVTEDVQAWMEQYSRKGDYVLAYNGFWILSYLDGRRPALPTSEVGDNQPPEPLLHEWLDAARLAGRLPRIVLVDGAVHSGTSLTSLLASDYREERREGEFTLYVRRGGSQ